MDVVQRKLHYRCIRSTRQTLVWMMKVSAKEERFTWTRQVPTRQTWNSNGTLMEA